MLDLDDPTQIALSDRQGWLTRAAQSEARWADAIDRGQMAAHASPLPFAASVIWLVLPTPLIGIGRAVQAARAHVSATPVICWQPSLASLPIEGLWFDPYHLLDGDHPRRVSLSAPAPHSHPSTIFLFLLAVLDGWLASHLAEEAIAQPEARLAQLLSSTASVPLAENPAKEIAYALHERLPLFWAEESLMGVAYDWWQRYILYAEAKAEYSDGAAIRRVMATTRFPRYWPQAGIFVRFAQNNADMPSWLAALDRLFQRRKLRAITVNAGIEQLPAAQLYLFEMGEWVALYAAALLGVDPAERVALDFLDALDAPSTAAQ